MGKAFFNTTMSTAFHDPRVTLIFDDAAKYLREQGAAQRYDVIICDSSDPVGPAETLFRPEFFQSIYDSLATGGIFCTQGECLWLHLELIANVLQNIRSIFSSAKYAFTTIPTYPSGQIGFMVGTKESAVDVAQPNRVVDVDPASLRYYSAEIHRACFILPAFAAAKLKLSS